MLIFFDIKLTMHGIDLFLERALFALKQFEILIFGLYI